MHIKISEIINANFKAFWKALKDPNITNCVASGGRASAKSFHISLFLVLAIMKYAITILCVRKVANTLADSIYEQLKEAIIILNVEHLFSFNKSPLRITYKPRGNSFLFRGADDPAKIKSIKASRYPLTFVWIEESAEFKTEHEITTITNSVLRAKLDGGLFYKVILSYNPPKLRSHWLNEKYTSAFKSEKTFHHHSTYLSNPHVSDEFISEANDSKRRNEHKYRWEYLGEPIGSGVVPFSNLEFREIDKKEIKEFDNIVQGLDFGYAVDPLAFVRGHYDTKKRTLYLFDEIFKVKCSNREISKLLKDKKYHRNLILADSAEPKSIAEIKSFGINIKGVKKGPGSVEYGEKWLDDLEKIIIDPIRCPNIYREFKTVDYQVDAQGNTLSRLEDKDNHTIDAVRYSCNNIMKRKRRLI